MTVDTEWRRTSYSSLVHVEAVAAAPVSSEPEEPPRDDEEPLPLPDDGIARVRRPPRPMAGLPVGATFGSLVHGVLEHTDPDAPDLRAELAARLADQLVRWPVELDRDALVEALVAVCDTSLGAWPTTGRSARSRWPTGCASSTSSSRSRAATWA